MGGSGVSAQNVTKPTSPGLAGLNTSASAQNNPAVQQALADYASGKISFEEAQAAGGGGADAAANADYQKQVDAANQQAAQAGSGMLDGGAAAKQAAAQVIANIPKPSGSSSGVMSQLLATDPRAAQRYNTDTIMHGADTSRLFGQGGALDESIGATGQYEKERGQNVSDTGALSGEEADLRHRGYSLKPEDTEAYGQMSDELARAFGQQEKGLGASLARSGLGAAPSGQAATLFSGIQGNKAEQLGNAQRQVAQARMKSTEDRLAGLRGYIGQQQNYGLGLGNLAQGARQSTANLGNLQEVAKSNLFNRSLAGRQQTGAEQGAAAGSNLAQQQAQQQQANLNFAQQQATRPPGVGEVLGAAGSGLLGAATGGIGAGIGAGLGGKVKGLFG